MTASRRPERPEKRFGHAAYCDSCERFDEGMRRKLGIPFCSYCWASLPGWPLRVRLAPLLGSVFIHELREKVRAEAAAN